MPTLLCCYYIGLDKRSISNCFLYFEFSSTFFRWSINIMNPVISSKLDGNRALGFREEGVGGDRQRWRSAELLHRSRAVVVWSRFLFLCRQLIYAAFNARVYFSQNGGDSNKTTANHPDLVILPTKGFVQATKERRIDTRVILLSRSWCVKRESEPCVSELSKNELHKVSILFCRVCLR